MLALLSLTTAESETVSVALDEGEAVRHGLDVPL